MADINGEVVGAKAQRDAHKNHKMESRELKFKANITDEQYQKAHKYEFFHRTFTQLVILIAIVMLAQSLINGTFTNPDEPMFTKISIILTAFVALIGMPAFVGTQMGNIKKNNDFWVNNQRFVLNFKGVSVSSQHGDRRLRWREFTRITESEDAILFKLYRFHMIVLPLADFRPDEKQQIKDIIMDNTRNLQVKVKLRKNNK